MNPEAQKVNGDFKGINERKFTPGRYFC